MNYLDRPITRRELAEAIDAAMDANRKGEDRDLPHLAAELRREPEATAVGSVSDAEVALCAKLCVGSATSSECPIHGAPKPVPLHPQAPAEATDRATLSDRAAKCDHCAKVARRPWLRPAPRGWFYLEATTHDPGDSIVMLACSAECAEAQWKAGPGERLDAVPASPAPAPAGVGWVVRREADYYVAHTALSVECDYASTACGQRLEGAALVPAELGERDTKLDAWHQEQRSAGSRRPLRRCAECALRVQGAGRGSGDVLWLDGHVFREVQGEWAVVLERPAYATKQAWVAHAATHVLDPAARVDHSELVRVQCRTEPVRAEARVNEREFGISRWLAGHQGHELVFCPECNRVRPVPR